MNLLIAEKTHDVIGEAILNKLKSSRPTATLPPATTSNSIVTRFLLYLIENFPKRVKEQLEEDFLSLIFVAKRRYAKG